MTVAPVSTDFQVCPSRGYRLLVAGSHALVLPLLLALPLPWVARSALLAGVFLSVWLAFYRYSRVQRYRLSRCGQDWILSFPKMGEAPVDCALLYKCRWLVVLRLRDRRRRWILPVFSDSLAPAEFRRLCRDLC